MMNEKAYLNHLSNNDQYLQSFQLDSLNISPDKIKIPFVGNLCNSSQMKPTTINPNSNKRQMVLFSPTFRKDSGEQFFVVDQNGNLKEPKPEDQEKSHKKSQYEYNASSSKYSNSFSRSISLPIKAYLTNLKNEPQRRLSTQHNPQQHQQHSKNKYLPKINLRSLQQKKARKVSMKKKEQKQQCQYTSKLKVDMLKKCYESDVKLTTNRSISSVHRLKTKQEAHNEYMLEKILTVKPTKDLTRRDLDRKFEQHKYYRSIRQHKNRQWSGFPSFLATRSKTLSTKQYIKL